MINEFLPDKFISLQTHSNCCRMDPFLFVVISWERPDPHLSVWITLNQSPQQGPKVWIILHFSSQKMTNSCEKGKNSLLFFTKNYQYLWKREQILHFSSQKITNTYEKGKVLHFSSQKTPILLKKGKILPFFTKINKNIDQRWKILHISSFLICHF